MPAAIASTPQRLVNFCFWQPSSEALRSFGSSRVEPTYLPLPWLCPRDLLAFISSGALYWHRQIRQGGWTRSAGILRCPFCDARKHHQFSAQTPSLATDLPRQYHPSGFRHIYLSSVHHWSLVDNHLLHRRRCYSTRRPTCRFRKRNSQVHGAERG